MNHRWPTRGLLAALLLLGSLGNFARAEEPAPAAASEPAKLTPDQLEQLVAPIALYSDALLMQVIMASTYPLELVEADRWVRQNAGLKDDALDKALESKDWDPSVEGLTHFPDLLKRMSENLDWTKDLGDAFLGQKDDVFAAIQSMRRKAKESGSLQTNEQQKVTTEVVNNKETIVVQPTNPEVVYVPQYAQTAYGPTYTAPPAYPSAYGYMPGMATGLLAFGTGMAVGALVSDGCNWGSGDVYVNDNYNGGGGGGKNNSNNNTNVNVNKNKVTNVKGGDKTWQHNPEHRRNVGYRDSKTQEKFQGRDSARGRDQQVRDQSRGYDRGDRGGQSSGLGGRQTAQGDRGRDGGGRDGGGRDGGANRSDRGGAGGGGGRGDARSSGPSSGGRESFGGQGGGRDTRQVSQRGASSRGTQSYAGGGGGGGGANRGGGGGHGGGGGGGGRGGGGGGGGRGGGGGGGGRGGGGGGGGRRR
jgi:hypothetical protein